MATNAAIPATTRDGALSNSPLIRKTPCRRLIGAILGGLVLLSGGAEGQCEGEETQELQPSYGVAGGLYGAGVAVDGDVALVGAVDDVNGDRSGSAYVFRYDGSTWFEEQQLLPSDGRTFDHFGAAVSLEGDVALVGAWNGDNISKDWGAAYVFRRIGSSWVEEQKLLPSDGANSDRFGGSVMLSGNVALVGAPWDGDRGRHSGSAYVFRYDGSSWIEEQKLVPSDGAGDDNFGWSLSVSGDVALISAYTDDDQGDDSGSAYIFRYNGSSWVEEQKLLPSNGDRWWWFGHSVSVNGSVALVGASSDDQLGFNVGSAYVFRYDGSSWVEEQNLLPSDGQQDDGFGNSVALNGNMALIGASCDDDQGTDSGSVYVFRHTGSAWVEERKLLPSDGADSDEFGGSVSLSGSVAVVGAIWNDNSRGVDAGAAYVFDASPVDLVALDVTRTRYDRPTTVTLTGRGFTEAPGVSVLFGSTPANNVVVVDDTTITCDTPVVEPGRVDVDVTVTHSCGSDTLADAFTFTPCERISGDWSPGGDLTLTYWLDAGDAILSIYGLPPIDSFSTSYDGTLCIWPYYRLFSVGSWASDVWTQTYAIPNDPSLSGITVALQALIGPSFYAPKDAAWTNCEELTLQ